MQWAVQIALHKGGKCEFAVTCIKVGYTQKAGCFGPKKNCALQTSSVVDLDLWRGGLSVKNNGFERRLGLAFESTFSNVNANGWAPRFSKRWIRKCCLLR